MPGSPGQPANESRRLIVSISQETFESLLDAARAGAEWAWSSLYRELAGPVTGYLASRGAAEPEDLTSEVFLQIARHIHNFDGDLAGFRSWVFVIAHRRLIDERRSRGRRPDFTELTAQNSPQIAKGDVEQEAVESLVTAELRDAFGDLTDGQQDVLALRIIAGLTLAETAEVLDKSVGAIKALQRRALEAVREHIETRNVTS